MKKKFFLVFLLSISLSLFAEVKWIFNLNPYFYFNNIPNAPFYYNEDTAMYYWDRENTSTFNNIENGWWMKSQDYWLLAYKKPSFLDLGLEVNTECFNLVTRFDIMQEPFANMQNQSSIYTNIPFLGAGIDLTFPTVGYVEYISPNKSFHLSLGRRLIKWGPGFYDIQIADSQPYLDNLWANYKTNITDSWIFNYNYVLVAPKFWLQYENSVQKTILGHKFSFYNDNLRLSLGELSNIYNKMPTLFDLSPLVVWHNGNQDEFCNVTLYLGAEGKIGPVRLFGTFNMDDFALPHEVDTSRPLAMGFSAGIEYHILDGNPIISTKFTKTDYTLREETFKSNNGLNIGLEWYYVTPMMYNRHANQNEGKFTIPWQIWAMSAKNYVTDRDAFFLGFRYGPNANLFRLYAEYKDNPFDASFIAEILTRGSYGIESAYGESEYFENMNITNMLALAGNKTTVLLLESSFSYHLQESLKAVASLDLQFDFTHSKTAFAFSLGFSCNPFYTDWKNLFSNKYN